MDVAQRPGVIDHRRLERPLVVGSGIVAGGLAVGGSLWASIAISDGHGLIILCGIVLLLPILMWRFEETSVLVIVAGALLVEQFPVLLGPDKITDGTSTIPLFASLSSGAGISELTFNPAEIIITLAIVLWIIRAAVEHEIKLPTSGMARAIGVLLLTVGLGLAIGLAHGGDIRISLIELRPWLYLGVVFLLASRLLRTRRALDALLWTVVLCVGIKALQGIYLIVQTHSLQPAPEAILGHEDSLFFGMEISMVAGLWLFGIHGRLRATATAILPLVLLADVGNHRRVAWAIAFAGVAVMLLVAYIQLPERRGAIRVFLAACALGGAIYLPLFWNDEGNLGQPARAVRSLIHPSARDAGSDQYRTLEDANLGINIHDSTPFGMGFGVPINYAIPIVDISPTDQLIKYVPHNGVLYVWMRLGWQGMLAFWAFIAMVVFAGLRLATAADPRHAMLGTLAVGTICGYVILGFEDLGLFWFRVALVMGALLGAVEATRRPLVEKKRVPLRPAESAAAAIPKAALRRRAAA